MYYRDLGGENINESQFFLGNGVSELISMSIQALVNPGDEILIPAPDYPLWTSVVNMYQGKSVHYICDEKTGWLPDLNDMESKITPKTKAIVVINPNNPTGAIYDKQTLQSITDIARKYNLLILSDEIYDHVIYDEEIHHTISSITNDVVCLTFSGLSKSVNLCGIRAGWLLVSGKPQYIKDYLDGLYLLSAMRLCPNVPMQYAIKATLEFYQSKNATNENLNLLVKRRNLACELINKIPGVSCIKPKGALYIFIKLDINMFDVVNDKQLALDFLKKEKVLILHGSAFSWFEGVFFRLVFLPSEHDIILALDRFERFLMSYRINRVDFK
jgi:alanine-synthesizing transaminase